MQPYVHERFFRSSNQLCSKITACCFYHSIQLDSFKTANIRRLNSFSQQLSKSHPFTTMAPIKKECDYLVLGGGSGGLASAKRASSLYGAKTIIVEVKKLGGTCVNVGCVPKKVTWHAASIRDTLNDAHNFGFSFEETKPFDWHSFVKKRSALVKRFNDSHEKNLNNDRVEYLHGLASFIDPHTVKVTLDDNERTEIDIKAKIITVAVGGYPNVPRGIEGAELGITSDGFFELDKQPKKVAIVGAGYIAVELAGMFHALGTETHMFIRQDKVLRAFDPMIQDQIIREYERQGIHLHKKSSPFKVTDIGSGWKTLHYTGQHGEATDDFDCILWAVGRSPELANLNFGMLMVDEIWVLTKTDPV